jgi:dolichyl-diphosphooligosaccharide---protein glycosyltransferase
LSGVVAGYAGDDMNKFLWIIRIAQNVYPDDLSESAFYNARGQYAVGQDASPTLRESLLYKMTYYDLPGKVTNRDAARGGVDLAGVDPRLSSIEHVFSSDNYIVRLYKVKDPDPLGRPIA